MAPDFSQMCTVKGQRMTEKLQEGKFWLDTSLKKVPMRAVRHQHRDPKKLCDLYLWRHSKLTSNWSWKWALFKAEVGLDLSRSPIWPKPLSYSVVLLNLLKCRKELETRNNSVASQNHQLPACSVSLHFKGSRISCLGQDRARGIPCITHARLSQWQLFDLVFVFKKLQNRSLPGSVCV